MHPSVQIAAIVVAAITAFLIVLGAPDAFRAQRSLPASLRAAQIRHLHLPNVVLTDHEGRSRLFYDDLVAGKIVAINFMYASCSKTCGLASQNMARLQDQLGNRLGHDVALYSISLDPDHDSPAALSAYRDKQGAKAGWHFFKPASVADVTELRRKLGVFDPDAAADAELSTHTGMIVLGNEPKGRWSMIPALVNPIRIRQALERVMLPPHLWPRGQAVVDEVPRDETDIGRTLQP